MKKAITIITLLLSVQLLYSQITNDTILLREYEVVSAANPVLFKQISRSIVIITKEQIQHSAATTVSDLLKAYGGVDIRSRGVMNVQSDINLRGGTFDQGLIMINGISLNDPQTGHHNLSQAIDLDDVEKIEIMEGSGSRWFGINAFAGGINIISKIPKNNSLSVSTSVGQYGYISGKIGVEYLINNLKNRTTVRINQSDGYTVNTDFRIININHSSYLTTKKGSFIINLGVVDKGFGANSFYTPKYPNQYEKIKTYNTTFTYESKSKRFKTNVYWRRNYDRFELFREDKNWYQKRGDFYIYDSDTAGFPTPNGLYPYKGHNYHRTDIAGADAGVKLNSILGSTAIGIGIKTDRIVSNVLGVPMIDTIFIKNSDGFYNKSKTRNSINFSINHYYSVKKFSVSGGLSAYYNNDYGAHFSPGIDLGYFVTDNIKVFACANHAIRIPTFTDLYYQGPTNNSNLNLQPETSISTEIGIKYLSADVNISMSGFYRFGKNIIDWIKYLPEEKWQSTNLSGMATYGISFSANKQFSTGKMNFVGLKYSWINSQKQNTEIISLYALDYLRHNLNVYLSHNIVDNFNASWSLSVQKRNGSFVDYETGKMTDYETVMLCNLKLLYIIGNFNISISGSNLLNKQYYDIGNVKQPGLWVIGGVSYTIGL